MFGDIGNTILWGSAELGMGQACRGISARCTTYLCFSGHLNTKPPTMGWVFRHSFSMAGGRFHQPSTAQLSPLWWLQRSPKRWLVRASQGISAGRLSWSYGLSPLASFLASADRCTVGDDGCLHGLLHGQWQESQCFLPFCTFPGSVISSGETTRFFHRFLA